MPLTRPVPQTWTTRLIGFVCFMVVPVLVSILIPASWVSLRREPDGQVSATAHTCVFFVIPWRTQRVANALGVESRSIRDDQLVPHRSRSYNRPDKGYIHSDGEAALTVKGKDSELTVSISPHSVDEVKAKAEAFFLNSSPRQLRFFTIANWKFGLGFGIPLTLLAVLYLVGSTLEALRALVHALRPVNSAPTVHL